MIWETLDNVLDPLEYGWSCLMELKSPFLQIVVLHQMRFWIFWDVDAKRNVPQRSARVVGIVWNVYLLLGTVAVIVQ